MRLTIPNLNLRQIALSGQCFRWKRIDTDIVCDADAVHKYDNGDSICDTYVIPPYGPKQREFAPLVISAVGEGTDEFELSCNSVDWDGHWSKYLDMDTDYDAVRERIMASKDAHLIEAYNYGSGVRILRQDTWEMIITFLISQNNNITRITRSVDEICRRHSHLTVDSSPGVGDDKGVSESYNPPFFPRPYEFDVEIIRDKSVGLGYRVPYIEKAIEVFNEDDKLLARLEDMSYEEAYETLVSMTGIGPKVANCICLFGLHHIEAFPIDTHVKQLLDKYYAKGFPYERYEGIAGIIQQYLFYYELKEANNKRPTR